MIELSKQNLNKTSQGIESSKQNVNVANAGIDLSKGTFLKKEFDIQLKMPQGETVAIRLNSPVITKQDIEPYRYLLKDATEIIFPEGIKEISWGVEKYNNVEKIVFPKSLEKIGGFAFAGFENLKGVEFKKGLRKIGTSAFADCPNLEWALLPTTIKEIGSFAFENCKSIMNTMYIPEGASVGDNAFHGCKNLTICIYKPTFYLFASIDDPKYNP